MVALSNPLDYHTYVWGNAEKMANAWTPMAGDHIGLTLIIVDYPHTDATDWVSATQAALRVRARTGRPVAVVATLPELMPEAVAAELAAGGVIPMMGLTEAIAAAEIASNLRGPDPVPPLWQASTPQVALVPEASAKSLLASFGLAIPRGQIASGLSELRVAASGLTPPLVLKGQGLAHKSEAGAVALNLSQAGLEVAANSMTTTSFLVEEMVQGAIAELLVGVTHDPAHGFVLTLGAGGVLTELWQDTVSLLVPAGRDQVAGALARLRIAPLINGYRGKPSAHMESILSAIEAVQACVIAHSDRISEIEVNPLICTHDAAIAADALIMMAQD